MLKATLRVTTFMDRRTVELHQRHDEIVRRRFVQRVERAVEARRAAATVTDINIPYLRRQAL